MSLLMIPHLLQESTCPGHRLQARRGDLSQMSNERGSGGCLGQIINLMYTFSTGDFLGNIGYHHWRSEALKIKVADLSPNYTFSETSRHTWILWIYNIGETRLRLWFRAQSPTPKMYFLLNMRIFQPAMLVTGGYPLGLSFFVQIDQGVRLEVIVTMVSKSVISSI